ARQADMPYRQLMELMSARLEATAAGGRADDAAPGADGYPDVAAFLADIDLIDASLAAHRGEHAGRFALGRPRRRVTSFGFHLASLDLRQDSAAHDAALGALEGVDDWAALPLERRLARLHALIDAPVPRVPGAEAAAATLDVFRTVRSARARYGADAFG